MCFDKCAIAIGIYLDILQMFHNVFSMNRTFVDMVHFAMETTKSNNSVLGNLVKHSSSNTKVIGSIPRECVKSLNVLF